MMSMMWHDAPQTRRTGHYIFDHEASAEEKKRILGDTVQEKAKLCQAFCKHVALLSLGQLCTALHSFTPASSQIDKLLQVTTAFTKGARRVEAGRLCLDGLGMVKIWTALLQGERK